MRRLRRVLCAIAVLAATGAAAGAPADAAPIAVTRLSGPDRFATAAKVSEATFAPGVPLAFVATGASFPDALAGAPAAAKGGGPILLTERDALPASTAAELDRLNPGLIVVLGGTSAVGQGVFDGLDPYTEGVVVRVAGADRYETAAAIAVGAFPEAVDTVYVATGGGFADALSGGPAAGAAGGPILLVEQNAVPTATAEQLDRLNPTTIVVLGGVAAVSAEVATELDTFGADVVRRSGADRYLTSVEVSKGAFSPGVTRVYLATGENFPDALAGGAPAALTPGPVLLVRPTCIPKAIDDEITRLAPQALMLLGGEGALSSEVATRTVCSTQFGAGTFQVGSQIPAGTYRTRANPASSCSWTRLSGFSGGPADLIENNTSTVHQIVTIKPTDAGFASQGCGTWTSDLSVLNGTPTTSVAPGMWFVETDMSSGTWTAPGGAGCAWARLRGFSGEPSDIIEAGGTGVLITAVSIEAGDLGFASEGCGTWSKSLI